MSRNKTTEEFINKANLVHKNKYNYDKVIYITSKINVIITCPKHGDFKQTPNAHICKRGCPICASSKGELSIIEYLKNKNINFIRQKIFKTIPPYNKLRFDFYLPFFNTIIEFNGAQHYRPVDWFGKREGYLRQVDSDRRKVEFTAQNNILFIVIPYWDFNKINEILEKHLSVAR
jgi:hypothetical protein